MSNKKLLIRNGSGSKVEKVLLDNYNKLRPGKITKILGVPTVAGAAITWDVATTDSVKALPILTVKEEYGVYVEDVQIMSNNTITKHATTETRFGVGFMPNTGAAGSASTPVYVDGGSSLDDITVSGSLYSGVHTRSYEIEITSAAVPDVFKWSDDGGRTWTTAVNCDTSAISLSNGVTVLWAASTGHAVGDIWRFDVSSTSATILAQGSTFDDTVTPIVGDGFKTITAFTPESFRDISTGYPLDSVAITTAGTGYAAGTLTFTGGGGAGAAGAYTVSGGVIDNVWLTNPGYGYTGVPVVGTSDAGNGDAVLTASVSSMMLELRLTAPVLIPKDYTLFIYQEQSAGVTTGAGGVTITDGGTGYSDGDLVFSGGGGTGAMGTYTNAAGVINAVNVTASGHGYTSTPTVTASHPGNADAVLDANLAAASGTALENVAITVHYRIKNNDLDLDFDRHSVYLNTRRLSTFEK